MTNIVLLTSFLITNVVCEHVPTPTTFTSPVQMVDWLKACRNAKPMFTNIDRVSTIGYYEGTNPIPIYTFKENVGWLNISSPTTGDWKY